MKRYTIGYILIVLNIVMWGIVALSVKKPAVIDEVIQKVKPITGLFALKETDITNVINKNINRTSVKDTQWGIVIKNLNGKDSYTFNEHQKFTAASLYKLWIMAGIYEQIEKGTLNKTQQLSASISDLRSKFNINQNELDATTSSGNISYTVEQALELMITESNNYAALLLANQLDFSGIYSTLEKLELNESDFGSENTLPQTTANDIAHFFELLYNEKIVSAKASKEMLELLGRQRLNHKIPAKIPKGTIIAHKTGELGTFSHDAGIMFSERSPILIVFLSNGPNPDISNSIMSDMAFDVLKFFEGDVK